MKKIFALLFIITALTSKAQVTNTNLSNFSFWDTEPFLAVNPTNSSNLIAAWMRATGIGQISIAVKSSSNGGATWSNFAYMTHTSPNFTSADVSIAFNSSGVAYLSYVDYKLAFDSGYVYVSSSTDGGLTWGQSHAVSSGMESSDLPIDRPWISCDRSGGTYDGRLYVVMKSAEAGTMPHHIWMKSSADGGITWTSPLLVDNAIPTDLVTNAMGAITVGADGACYIAYPSYHIPSSVYARMIVVKSIDGGNTFTPYVIGNAAANSAITDSLLQGSYSLQANPTNAGNVVLVFTDNRNGDADILSSRSTDGGMTWSAPIRITDDPISNGNNQDMCWAAFSQNGIFVTSWRDRRNTGGGSHDNFEMYTTASANGGSSFGTNVNISTAQSPYVNIVKGNDFVGVGSDGTNVITDWCDNRTGNTEIFFNSINLSNILSVNENDLAINDLAVFPNPVGNNGVMNCSFTFDKNESAQLKIFTVDGKETGISQSVNLNSGKNVFAVNLNSLAKGNYILVIESGNKILGKKIFER